MENKIISIVSGGFDPIHPGHIMMMKDCRKFSDYLIVGLRKKNGPGYHLPNKFLHKYISSPNYFGEIIEWIGWAVLTWSVSGLVFLIWTIANLFPRAIAHHKWYKEKFDDYPENRKAIIPGII